MMTYGDLYMQAVNADPTAGMTIIRDESGNPILPSDAYPGQPTPEMLAQAFDPRKWFNQQGIIPLSAKYYEGGSAGNPDTTTQEQQNAYQQVIAQKYGFPSLDAMLKYTTGPGQYVNDPTLGLLWVPNNKDYQTWNRSYVGP